MNKQVILSKENTEISISRHGTSAFVYLIMIKFHVEGKRSKWCSMALDGKELQTVISELNSIWSASDNGGKK